MIGVATFQYFILLIIDFVSLWWWMISFEKQRRAFIMEYKPYFYPEPIDNKLIERQFGIQLSWIVFAWIIIMLILRDMMVDCYTLSYTNNFDYALTIFARICIASSGIIAYGFVYLCPFRLMIKTFKYAYNTKLAKKIWHH